MTVQISERIIYKNEETWTDSEPLKLYLLQRNDIHFVAPTSACWRGYKGKWEVKENELFLIKLEANVQGYEVVDLNYLFPNQKNVFADWFTGDIILSRGKCLNEDDDTYLPIYEEEIILKFKNGLLQEEIVKNNLPQNKINDETDIFDLLRSHNLHSTIKFGKHRGKTILQIYTGNKSISQKELEIIHSICGENDITPSKSLHIVHGLLKGTGSENLIPEGQKILMKFLPDPDYINWCILNVDGFEISTDDLEMLEKSSISTLTRIIKKDKHFEAVFENTTHYFPSEIKNKVSSNESQFQNEEEINYVNYEDDTDDNYSSQSGFCPACQGSFPCGCNYSFERDY